MADPYTSFTTAPLPNRPYGPLTGLATADADFMQRQAQLRSLEDMFTANDQRKAELQRYQGQTPGMVDESNYAGALARGKQGIIPQTLQGLVGEAQSKQAAGKEAMGTVDSKIDTTNSQNRTKAAQAQLEFLDSRMPMLEQAAGRSPMEAQMVWDQMLQESKAPFPRQFDQTTLPNLKKIRDKLVNSVTQQQKLGEIQATGDQHARVADIQGSTSRAVANINQEGQNWRKGLSAEEKASTSKIESFMRKMIEKSASGETLTEHEKDAYLKAREFLLDLAISRGGASGAMGMQFLNNGAPTNWPRPPAASPPGGSPQQPPQPGQVPPPNQRQVGQVYPTPKGPMKWTGTGWVPAQ